MKLPFQIVIFLLWVLAAISIWTQLNRLDLQIILSCVWVLITMVIIVFKREPTDAEYDKHHKKWIK